MKRSNTQNKEGIGSRLIEDINQLQRVALGEGVVVCQVCGSELPAGSSVSVFVYRRAGEPSFEVGHVLCGNDHELPTYFTLGVRELIVDGHIGRCVDPTTQSSWPILLEPSVRVVSTMESTTGWIAPDSLTDSSGEVSWVYGDALLDRATDLDPDDPHDVPGDDSSPPSAAGDSDGVVPPADTDCPPGSRDDTIPADADSPPAAGTGPTGSDTAVPADADGSPTDTDETNADTEGGEC